MPRYNRGGAVDVTGRIGRLRILRQQFLLPGEILKPRVSGSVTLTPMRERARGGVHARIDAFVTPIRWLWDDWPAYLNEGPGTTKSPPLVSHGGIDASDLGIGGTSPAASSTSIPRWYHDAPLRIYNEWYKWPEDADETSWRHEGLKCVNLAHSFTRLQQYDGIMSADSEVSTAGNDFDVRALAETQARYRQAVEQDWIAHGRYVDLLRECWNANGSREVDQVPMRLNGAEVGVRPYDQRATDSGGLGARASFFDFNVDHRFQTIAAPEHVLVTYMLLLRFRPMAEDEFSPLALTNDRDWASIVGEPGILAAKRPEAVRLRNLTPRGGATTLGYLPAGWQYRARWNVVGTRFDDQNSFPYLANLESRTSAALLRDSTIINPVFTSSILGDFQTDLEFDEWVDSPIPGPRSSLFSGTGDAGRGSAYPYPGPRRVV